MAELKLAARDFKSFCTKVATERYGRAHGRYGSTRNVEHYILYRVVDEATSEMEGIICDRHGYTVRFGIRPNHSTGSITVSPRAGSKGWGGDLPRVKATQKIARMLHNSVTNAARKTPDIWPSQKNWDGFYLKNTPKGREVSPDERACFAKAEDLGFMPREFVEQAIKWKVAVSEKFPK